MASKYKRTISAVLVLMNIIQYKCQSIDADVPKVIVPSLPAEHLLRGSGETHDERPVDIVRTQIDFDPHKHELPFNNEQVQTQERPMVFFNVEAQSVKMSDKDMTVDPVTGQTVIKFVNPYQEANEEAKYTMRPTDVSLKNLQGFYVSGDETPTEVVETAIPIALNIASDAENGDIKAELPPTAPIKLSEDLQTKLPKTIASNISSDIWQISEDVHIPETPETPEILNDTMNDSVVEDVKETTTDFKATEATEESITANDADDATESTDEDADVYKQESSKAVGETDNKEDNVTHWKITSTTKEALTSTTSSSDDDDADSIEEGVGSRLGFEEDLLTSVVESVGQQRNPKVKATPAQDQRNLEVLHRPKVKLTKRETLRSWLQDPWLRSPIGILVPLKARSIGRALAVWNDVTNPEGLNVTDVLVIGYDENGIGWLSKHNLQSSSSIKSVANALQKLLLKHQTMMSDDHKGDAALHACAWAAKLVPYDSALFIVTDSAPSDAQRLPAALRAIIDKRLKLYTIWTDPLYQAATSDQAVLELMKASKYTEGEFLDYHPTVTASNDAGNLASESTWNHNVYRTGAADSRRTGRLENGIREKYETLLVRRINGGGPSALGIPVEEGVESLRVSIDGTIDRAALYPPSGPQIDLFNASFVNAFAPGSRIESTSPLEALLVFPMQEMQSNADRKSAVKPTTSDTESRKPTVGLWRLNVRCGGCEYRVVVTALAPIGLDATMIGDDMVRLRARGPIASVRETILVDEYGTELTKLPFSHQPSAKVETSETSGMGDDDVSMTTLVADVPLPSIKRSTKVYAKIVGRDIYGESYTRVAGPIFKQDVRTSRSASISFPDDRREVLQSVFNLPEDRTAPAVETNQRLFFGNNQTSTISPIIPIVTSQISSHSGTLLTAVQVGLSTRLYGAPGDNLQLHFEVSNYRERNINFRFEATGNLRFLRGIRPSSQWINSGQTANVIVDVGITNSAQAGARDLITFTAYGLDQVSISAYIYVINSELQIQTDTWAPNVRHTFQGDCMTKQGDDCARHSWAATIYARDNDGGLLRLSSSPVGLRYENTFVAGTREEVTATYRATCCAPRMLVNAVDANGNANTYTVDITYYIPDAAIAAIVLGVLLVIALIALIIFFVYICIRRRKESRQLPSYATPRREA